MKKLFWTIFIFVLAWSCFYFLPLSKLSVLSPWRLNVHNQWRLTEAMAYFEETAPKSLKGKVLWVGSSLMASFLPESLFVDAKQECRVLASPWCRPSQLLELSGRFEKGAPETLVLCLGADFFLGPMLSDDYAFNQKGFKKRKAWQMLLQSLIWGPESFLSGDVVMRRSLSRRRRYAMEQGEKMFRDALSRFKGIQVGLTYFERECEALEVLAEKNEIFLVFLPINDKLFQVEMLPLKMHRRQVLALLRKKGFSFLDLSREKLPPEVFIDWGHFDPGAPALQSLQRRLVQRVLR
jgi:hypothetical protein